MENVEIHLPAAQLFHIGPFAITNTMLLGAIGITVMCVILVTAARQISAGRSTQFSRFVQWVFEGMYGVVYEIIPDKKMARNIAPLALTIFFTVLSTYWISLIPGVGSITLGGKELLRGLPTDLNFTFALAIVSMVAVQWYAIKTHGFFGNGGRYIVNPFKNPIGFFEGLLELVGELSRLVALSLRLFGNAFAGEVLLIIVGVLSGYFATLSLPLFMAFELFIGFIQAYVFFMLTLIFAALATQSHGDSHPDHSPAIAHAKAQE
ncbi:F0F1 ATP synthase subunit A [Candidatus Saccharibacteria bacterium]|nr:F0F1 ATP synthase subunit A [Candidatus Saccharibacteria bacterium]